MSSRVGRLDPTFKREAYRKPAPPAPAAADPLETVLALQRSAGNQAIGRLLQGGGRALQRSVKVGLPGGNTTHYAGATGVESLMTALNAKLGTVPPWVTGLVQTEVTTLVTGAVAYEFDSAGDIVDWVLLKNIASKLLTFARDPNTAKTAPRGARIKEYYTAVEAVRKRFQQAGDQATATQASDFTLFGYTYQLKRVRDAAGNFAVNHYYASRNGKTVVYGDLKRMHVKSILEHLLYHGETLKYKNVEHVDNFVCSFLAEPTRWPEEQVFNLLAATREGEDQTPMVSANVGGTLPMAAGSTWSISPPQVGQQLPRRALEHARSENILQLILSRLQPAPASLPALTIRVALDLQLVQAPQPAAAAPVGAVAEQGGQ